MKPNIIFYFSDQQRFDTINEKVTPNLFSLAKDGVECINAYTCQPVCGPARACLQTGIYASKNGCYRNDIPLDSNYNGLAKILNENNYNTAYIGKWHLASGKGKNYQTKPIPPLLHGGYAYTRSSDCLEFTSDGYGGYVYDENGNKITFEKTRSDAINDFAIEYINNAPSDKPFFMFVSQLDPHHQNSTDSYECIKGAGEQFKDIEIPKDLTAYSGNYNRCYSDYLACCNRIDYNIGILVDTLKAQNIYDNTIIIYTSDHGCHFKTRNFEYKRSCHDASLHIPLIVFGGAIDNKMRYDGLISLIDMPSTILSIAGITIPQDWDGYNLFDMIDGKIQRENVYVEISESQLGRAIRTKDYTYSVKKRKSLGVCTPDSNVYIEDKLYDNNLDPHQTNNLIKDSKYSDIRYTLRKQLLEEIKRNTNKEPKIKSKLTKFKLNP